MMGEYILLDGQPYKLGTVEDLYYCRYADLVEWINAGRAAKMPGNDDPADYLAGAYRFRFPFPDEDKPERLRLAIYDREYDRGVLIPYPPELLTSEIDHYQASVVIQTYHNRPLPLRAWGRLPCPLSPAGANFYPTIALQNQAGYGLSDRVAFVELVQQRPLDGMLWPIFRCPWCGTRWRVTHDEAVKIAAHAQAKAPGLDLEETMRRMLAGYDGLPGRPVSFDGAGGA